MPFIQQTHLLKYYILNFCPKT